MTFDSEMKTRMIIWSLASCLVLATGGIVIWEIKRSGHAGLGAVSLLALLAYFLVACVMRIVAATVPSEAEVPLSSHPRRVNTVRVLSWVALALFVVAFGIGLYLDRERLKEIGEALLYWKVIITGRN